MKTEDFKKICARRFTNPDLIKLCPAYRLYNLQRTGFLGLVAIDGEPCHVMPQYELNDDLTAGDLCGIVLIRPDGTPDLHGEPGFIVVDLPGTRDTTIFTENWRDELQRRGRPPHAHKLIICPSLEARHEAASIAREAGHEVTETGAAYVAPVEPVEPPGAA